MATAWLLGFLLALPWGCLSRPDGADALWPQESGWEPRATTGLGEPTQRPLALEENWVIWLGVSVGFLLAIALFQVLCYCCTEYFWRSRRRLAQERQQDHQEDEASPSSRCSESDHTHSCSSYETLSSSSEENLQIVPA